MTLRTPAWVAPEPDVAPPARHEWTALGRLWRRPAAIWCLALVPHAIAVFASAQSIARGRRTGNLQDFLNAARAMRHGADIYASGTGGYVYPPLIAFLYQPLAGLTDRTAGFVVLAVGSALSIFTLALVSRVLVRRLLDRVDPLLTARVAALGAFCTLDKIKGEFSHLETNVLMLLAFTAAMRWVDRRPWLCGAALGFAFNVKYMPLVLVPYLLLRRRWRATAWFALWAVAFAVLPATSMGWRADGRAWAEAAGGMSRLFGLDLHVDRAAHVRAVTDAVSISLTSGLARLSGARSPLPLAATVAAAFAVATAAVYVRRGVPLVRWPAVSDQHRPPYRGLLSTEWIGLLLLTLTFSPFTNSRHLYMLLDVNIAAAVLLLGTAGRVNRGPLLAGLIVMALGISLPPGGTRLFDRADVAWRTAGGPGWCMLAMGGALIWTNVGYQWAARRPDRPIAEPEPVGPAVANAV